MHGKTTIPIFSIRVGNVFKFWCIYVSVGRLLLIGVVIVVVVAVASALILTSTRHSSAIVVNAPYAFIIRQNDSWIVEWFSLNGSLHTLGPFNNLNDPDILNAMSVVDSFNQQVVPQHSGYQPLASIIVIGAGDVGKQGVVVIPVSGNTIELKNINPGYYTLVAVPQQYTTQLIQTLDMGYKLSATVKVNELQYLQYHNPQTWKLVVETINLQQYSSSSNMLLGGSFILETSNNTLIPWGFLLYGASQHSYGISLPFIKQASINTYIGHTKCHNNPI